MPDPLTLSAVGIVALTEGVKFLYGLAGDLLRRRRERRDDDRAPVTEPVSVALPDEAFQGQLKDPVAHFDRLADLDSSIRELRAKLADYAEGIDDLSPDDRESLEYVDGLRRALETVLGQRIVFRGEAVPADGSVVGTATVDEVLGYVAGLRARSISGGARGHVEAGRVGPGGSAVGLEADTIR